MQRWQYRLHVLLYCLIMCCVDIHADEFSESVIKICDDGAEWPPYSYFDRSQGRKSDQVIGYSVDVIEAIFSKHELKFTVELLPWARCQEKVAAGDDYQLALNASYNLERDRTYHLLAPYYSMSNYYFYSLKNHPNGLDIDSVQDLKKYSVCGISGYNYATYNLSDSEVDQGTKDFPALISKLHKGRCDLFVEKYEILAGFAAIGVPFLSDKALGKAPIPGMASTPFYMMLSRNYRHKAKLKKILDNGLDEMKKSGQLQEILNRYIPLN